MDMEFDRQPEIDKGLEKGLERDHDGMKVYLAGVDTRAAEASLELARSIK